MATTTDRPGPGDFVAHVRAQAARYGRTRSCTYLRGAGRELVEEVVAYEELGRDARAIAAWLATRPERDRPVLLLHPDGIDFLRAFLGCLYAGVVGAAELLAVARDDLRLCAGHRDRGEPPLPCPIHVFGADAGALPGEADVRAWERHRSSPVELRVLPSGHFAIRDDPAPLLEHVRAVLRRHL